MRIIRKITKLFSAGPTLSPVNDHATGFGIVAVVKDGDFVEVKDAGIEPGEYKTEILPDGTLKISPK